MDAVGDSIELVDDSNLIDDEELIVALVDVLEDTILWLLVDAWMLVDEMKLLNISEGVQR